jgi:glycine betaine/choline ABC-type transport system substrate-binding protein
VGLERVYGLRFRRTIPIDVADRHEVILKGKADLTIPFTTDGQIAANREVVLEDDKDLFPPYNVTFVLTRRKAEELGPRAEAVVTTVQRGLTTPVMRELNSRADLDRQAPAQVAADYLKSEGFVR